MTKALIAVVGASNNPAKYGHRIFGDLLAAGYSVVPVNPSEKTILEQPVYGSLAEVPTLPEIVITVVPPAVTEAVVKSIIESQLPIGEIWMQPGSESAAAAQLAEAQGLTVHQACFMKAEGVW